MNPTENVILHNRFDVTVCDAASGEVKQKAVGYNVILDNYMKWKLCQISGYYGVEMDEGFNRICVGTGTGTPTITDTDLFTSLFNKETQIIEQYYAYPTSHVTFQIKVNADEYNGNTFTEVGLGFFYRSSLWDYPTLLMTHAMLQDSEGNQIAIQKTDTDVVYINATFFVTFSQTGFGTNGIYPKPEENMLVKWLTIGASNIAQKTHFLHKTYSSDLAGDFVYQKNGVYFRDSTGNLQTLTLTVPVMSILDTEWNNHLVRTCGIAGIGAFQFPDSSVFPDYTIDHLVLGEGDGTTTEFSIKCPHIKSGTIKIYVNSVELSPSDYEVDYDSNCTDATENYYTSVLNCQSSNVSFGNLATRSPDANHRYQDPLYWGVYPTTENKYPNYCYITSANPIWIDLGSAKECNRIKIDNNQIQTSQLPNLVIEKSDDNSQWTSVAYTCEQTSDTLYHYVFKFALTSARYWRVYIPNYSWCYYLYYDSSVTPVSTSTPQIKSTFFLGRTVPGLKLLNAPASGQTVEASYKIDIPFKTENNLMRLALTIQLQRG